MTFRPGDRVQTRYGPGTVTRFDHGAAPYERICVRTDGAPPDTYQRFAPYEVMPLAEEQLRLETVPFPDAGRDIFARPDTTDRRTVDDARTGRYHVPPHSMPAPRTVLDLGANIGATAAHYREMWPGALVVAVEMDEANRRVLSQNFDGPVLPYAVGSVTGPRTYDVGRAEDAYRLGPGRGQAVGARLYDILAAFTERRCDFAKVDVEGAEWELLADLGSGVGGEDWAGLVRYLLVELHGDEPPDALVARAIRLLQEGGYAAERHEAHPAAVYARWEGE